MLNLLVRLKPYLKPHWGAVAIIIISGVVMSLSQTAVVAQVKPLFNEGFSLKDRGWLIQICLTILGLYTLHAIARFVHMYLMKFTTEQILVKMQSDLQDRYMSLSLAFHSDKDSGSHISRVINDIGVIQWGLNILADFIREPLLVVSLLILAVYLDWKLSLMILVAGPLMGWILASLGRSVRKYSRSQQEALEKLTTTMKETLDGLRVVQSFNLENERRRVLANVVKFYLEARKKIITRQESAGPTTELLGVFVFTAAAFYMGERIIAGEKGIGDFIAYIGTLGTLQAPLKKIQDGWARLQQTLVSVDRVFSVLESQDVIPEKKNPTAFPENWDEISFEKVRFSYSKNVILKGIDLKIKRGEVIAFVGESGSGKSTLVNLLQRFFDPTEGVVRLGGVDLKDLSLNELRSHIGLVTQDVFLFNQTIEENIRLGRPAQGRVGAEEAAKMANAHDFIMNKPLGYQNLVGERGNQLSGGEKQRVSIARALYKDAPIMILDEATSALDSASEVEVQKGLDRLMEGRTALVIAHRLSTVTKADRIVVMKDGEIVEIGTHHELLARGGTYAHFHKLQIV
jgi:subfamily B ATP-binding cassette protein MsbA